MALYVRDRSQAEVDQGLYTLEAEFVTEHLVIQGELSSPEGRLSDHLNSSSQSVEIQPTTVRRIYSGDSIDLAGAHAHVTKAHLLFIVPIVEPARPQHVVESVRTSKMTKQCWAALGRYSIVGQIHAEALRDPRLILRGLEHKQFLPFTDAQITAPDGSTHSYGAVLVNRAHLEMLALRNII